MNSVNHAAVLTLAALLYGMGAQPGLAAGKHADHGKSEACYQTTRLMLSACHADVRDDLFEDLARCVNGVEQRECSQDAKEAFREARAECSEQAEGRDNLCERLPDAGPYVAEIDPNDFDGTGCPGGNPYFPLVPGTVTTFVNDADEEELETIVVTVTDETREIQGVETIVVRDTVYEGLPDEGGEPTGDRIEDTDDYYALANNCDVWYFGEISQNFEDGYLNNLDGSFIAGEGGAQAGIIMLGNPMPGDVYRQEFALGDAEDAGAVLELGAAIFDEDMEPFEFDDPDFNCSGPGDMCLKTEDFVANEPDATEFKFFKPGIGFVAEQLPDGEIVLRLIKIEPALP